MAWTQQEAIEFCRRLEAVAPFHGCHVALIGGCLYKDGPRKDLDIVIYRIRQKDEINVMALFAMLEAIGVTRKSGHGFVIKAEYLGKKIDFLFPEEEGNYDVEFPDDL